MGFTQPCFIRKNTPELCNKLEKFGYEPCYQMTLRPDKYDNLFVSSKYGDRYFGYDNDNMQEFNKEINELIESKQLIDCGDNEELFLALAALRDDSNENQWFIATNDKWDEDYNGEITVYYDEGDWLLWGYYSFMEYMSSDFRKATVKEIIDHFKK